MVFHVFPSSAPHPQRDEKRPVRGYYARSVLTDAIRVVMEQRMTVNESAEFHKIPRPTLQRKVSQVRKEHQKAAKYRQMMEKGAMPAEEPGSSTQPRVPVKRKVIRPQPEPVAPAAEECCSTAESTTTLQQPFLYHGAETERAPPPKKTYIISNAEMNEMVRDLNSQLPKTQAISMNIGRLLCNDGFGNTLKEYIREGRTREDDDDALIPEDEDDDEDCYDMNSASVVDGGEL